MNRRRLLAGAAALPVAGLVVPAAAGADPALDAARRWIAADAAEAAFAYDDEFHGGNWDDDPRAVALSGEERRCWQEMLATPPTTPEALALMLACCIFRIESGNIGSHFSDPDGWYADGVKWQGMIHRLLPVLWESPAAAALFPQTTPPCDVEAVKAKAEADRLARLARTA